MKTLEEFNSQGKYCKPCHRQNNRDWRQRNAEKNREAQKKHNAKRRQTQQYKENQKVYCRRSYVKNPGAYKARSNEWKARSKAFILRVKRRASCARCKEADARCLQFHHLRDKEHAIGDMVKRGFGVKAIKNEMRKCAILCANCHAKEHGDVF